MAEDVTKLPKWAQWRISKLESDLEFCLSKLANFEGIKSSICIDPDAEYIRKGGLPSYLPNKTGVEYEVDNGKIEITLRQGVLEAHASEYADARLAVIPNCSNVVYLQIVKEGQ